jgi:hypothetical protein
MLVLCLVAGCLVGPGQFSAAYSTTKTRGESIMVEVHQDMAAGTAPTTLKWDLIFPAQLMEMEGKMPDTGEAATASGKTLQCNRIKPYSYTCLLFGGDKPIANGALAIFHFKILETAPPTKTTLRLEQAEGTTADAKAAPLKGAEVTVTIR